MAEKPSVNIHFEKMDLPANLRLSKEQLNCSHEKFFAQVNVQRIKPDGLHLTEMGFSAEMTITCEICKAPFHFMGLPEGIKFDAPTRSVGGIELRAPIKPGYIMPVFKEGKATVSFEAPSPPTHGVS